MTPGNLFPVSIIVFPVCHIVSVDLSLDSSQLVPEPHLLSQSSETMDSHDACAAPTLGVNTDNTWTQQPALDINIISEMKF